MPLSDLIASPAVHWFLRKRWLVLGCLLAIGLLGAKCWSSDLVPALAGLLDGDESVGGPIPAREVPYQQRVIPANEARATTKHGRRIKLYRVADANRQMTSLRQHEEALLQAYPLHLIRTARADESHNCHGWVFTAGAYWLFAPEVKLILDDNGYQEVHTAHVNDVVIYRDADGVIVHCGIVRMTTSEGLVLIESKWGPMGRFIHRPEDCSFGDRRSYYRGSGPDHLVQIATHSSGPD